MTRTFPSEECRYQPNGDMCLVCQKALANCSQFPFREFQVIDKYKDGQQPVLIVRCRQYEREASNGLGTGS